MNSDFQRGKGGFGGHRGGFGGPRSNHNGGPRGGAVQSQFIKELEIAKKFPAEYAEIEKKREEYEAALSALAAKAGVELPQSRDAMMRSLRKADPAAFDAVVEKMKTSPREGFQELMSLAGKHGIKLFGDRAPGGMSRQIGSGERTGENIVQTRKFRRPDMQALRRKYPDKMREYDSLRRQDPEKARELLLQITENDESESGKK